MTAARWSERQRKSALRIVTMTTASPRSPTASFYCSRGSASIIDMFAESLLSLPLHRPQMMHAWRPS